MAGSVWTLASFFRVHGPKPIARIKQAMLDGRRYPIDLPPDN
jgi:hypothetical protein